MCRRFPGMPRVYKNKRNRGSTALRRCLFAMTCLTPLFFASLSQAEPGSGEEAGEGSRLWAFDVSINDRWVGQHEFEIFRSGSRERVESRATFRFKLLFVTVFSYEHQNEEVWSGDCLEKIDSNSRMNGDRFFVEGRSTGSALVIQSQDGTQELAPCVRTFAYWNPAILSERALLNAQTGQLEDVEITAVGEEVFDVGGASIPAVKYRIELAQSAIEVWYSASQTTWLGLSTITPEGQSIRYKPKTIPESEHHDNQIVSLGFSDLAGNGGD